MIEWDCARTIGLFSRPWGAGGVQPERSAALVPRRGKEFAAPQALLLVPALAREGKRRARRDTKGGILFSKRIPPLNPPEKGEGSPPSTPDIGGL